MKCYEKPLKVFTVVGTRPEIIRLSETIKQVIGYLIKLLYILVKITIKI